MTDRFLYCFVDDKFDDEFFSGFFKGRSHRSRNIFTESLVPKITWTPPYKVVPHQ